MSKEKKHWKKKKTLHSSYKLKVNPIRTKTEPLSVLCSLAGLSFFIFHLNSYFLSSFCLNGGTILSHGASSVRPVLADSSVIAADRQYCTPWRRWRGEGGGGKEQEEGGGRRGRWASVAAAAPARLGIHVESECGRRHLVAATTRRTGPDVVWTCVGRLEHQQGM